MTAMTIRALEPDLKAKLRVRAAQNGRSMEAEVRAILADALNEPARPQNLVEAIRAVAVRHGGVDLELPVRRRPQRPIDLG